MERAMGVENTQEEFWTNLVHLAKHLSKKKTHGHLLAIPMVGAGASKTAGIPTGEELKYKIVESFCDQQPISNYKKTATAILQDEAQYTLGHGYKGDILRHNLFEVAAVVSKFAYGRTKIKEVVDQEIGAPKSKPFSYEILAHLAKHHYLDHFISLNFDTLLDESLSDELPERLKVIAGSEDLPGPRYVTEQIKQKAFLFNRKPENPCFLLKPFGSLTNDKYMIRTEDVLQFGADSLWQYSVEQVFRAEGTSKYPDIILILVGYAAAEEAFMQLVRTLLHSNRDRKISIYNINTQPTMSSVLKDVSEDKNVKYYPIIDPDGSEKIFPLLGQLIKGHYKEKYPNSPWVPISRHEIVSHCIPYEQTRSSESRFQLELILQAVKSRGFFTIESISHIDRIRRYADNANTVIRKMCKEGVFATESTLRSPGTKTKYQNGDWCQDYRLQMDIDELVEYVIEKFDCDREKKIIEWRLGEKEGEVSPKEFQLKKYLTKRLTRIQDTIDIEISLEATPSSQWLFKEPELVLSLADMGRYTNLILGEFLREHGGRVEIYGIWSTGEWLFLENGYAWKCFGKRILKMIEDKVATMELVLSEPSKDKSMRTARGKGILEILERYEGVTIHQIEWWRHNRRLTLVKITDANGEVRRKGIYFRRRLSSPLVSPIFVQGDDCKILEEMFNHYRRKAQNTDSGYSNR